MVVLTRYIFFYNFVLTFVDRLFGLVHPNVGSIDADWVQLSPTTCVLTAALVSKRAPIVKVPKYKMRGCIFNYSEAKKLLGLMSEQDRCLIFLSLCNFLN
jgi:hypothetical protein